jgi:hypothetical protein
MPPNMHSGMNMGGPHSSIAARGAKSNTAADDDDNTALFGDIPEARKRKFILVDDPARGSRVRVRVTLDTVDISQIPDSYRKTNSVYPRSFFPLQMQSPPPNGRFAEDDDDDDRGVRDGGRGDGPSAFGKTMVKVPLADGSEAEVACPKMRRSQRGKEVKLNDLGYRMAWQQSRVFAGRAVFLQRACMCTSF